MCCLVQVMCSFVCEVAMSEFKVENSSTPGNYTFASVKGTESYLLLQTSLKDVWNNINSLLENPRIKICGRSQELHIVIGGDLTV